VRLPLRSKNTIEFAGKRINTYKHPYARGIIFHQDEELMLEITETARNTLKDYLDKNPGKVVCIEFLGFGCTGPSLSLALGVPPEDAQINEIDGIKVFIQEDVQVFSDGQIIDYVKNDEVEGFRVTSTGGFSCSGDCSSCGQ
jgi:Fe-S cluster assembly iron-binding protein IscA